MKHTNPEEYFDIGRFLEWAYREIFALNLADDPRIQESLALLVRHQTTLPAALQASRVQYIRRRIFEAKDPDFIPFRYHPAAFGNETFDGLFKVGWIENSEDELIPYAIGRNEGAHILEAGSTGSGKSNFKKVLYYSALGNNINLWVFEPQQDFTSLRSVVPSLIFFNEKNLFFNPQEVPQGMHPDIWLSNYVDLWCENQGLLMGGNSCYITALHRLYQLFGVYDGSQNYPTLADTYNFLLTSRYQTASQSEREIRGRVIQRLLSSLSVMHRNLNCCRGLTVRDLEGKSVVFQLGNIKETGYDLVVSTLVFQEYLVRMVNNRVGPLDLMIGIDEGSRLCARKNETQAQSILRMQTVIERCRKYGMALEVAVQQLSGVARFLISNCTHIFFFFSSSGEDKEAFGRAAQLNQQQFIYLSRIKPKTHCIVSTIKFPRPLLLRTINFDKYLPRSEKLDEQDLLRGRKIFRIAPPDATLIKEILKQEAQEKKTVHDAGRTKASPDDPVRLDKTIGQISGLLKARATKFYPKNELFQKLNLSKIERELIEQKYKKENLFVEQKIRTTVKEGIGGRTAIFLRLPQDMKFEHEYWTYRIQNKLETRGFKIEPEKFDCDLVHEDDNGLIRGWEYEKSGTRALKNVQRNLNNGFSSITVICDTGDVLEKVQRLVAAHISPENRRKIRIISKSDFFSGRETG